MKIEILGTQCTKCKAQEAIIKEAVAKVGGFFEVKKVDDIQTMMSYGVFSTPALVIDGVVKASGKVLSLNEVVELIKR